MDFASARVTLKIYDLEDGARYLVELTKKAGFIETFDRVCDEISADFGKQE